MTQSSEKTMKAIIVDDEDLARQGMALRLAKIEGVSIVAECANGKEALMAIIEHEPDIAFLDIQMPVMTGFELISEIQSDILPLIIFVTAYDAFAIDAFKVHAIDYLLKPVEEDRLVLAI